MNLFALGSEFAVEDIHQEAQRTCAAHCKGYSC